MRYYSTQRPIDPGTFPSPDGNKVVDIHNYDSRIYCEEVGQEAWGYIDYEKPLSPVQAANYELLPTRAPKILYFEGAGWSGADISKATIGNCRIRTAFHLDDGRAVYLEITGSERTRHSPSYFWWPYTGFLSHCYYITDDEPNDDCNKHRVILPRELSGSWRGIETFEYTEAGILQFVNSLGASFDAIKVVPDLGGYRVFPEGKSCQGPDGYYYGDKFKFDPELTARREAIHRHYYELEKSEGKEHPNFSLWVDEHDPGLLHLLRHFSGDFHTAHNRHWIIRVDGGGTLINMIATAQETTLGKYGC